MKISNSKKELARIISENGGWQSGKFCAQQDDGEIWFSKCQPRWNKGQGTFTMHYENHITAGHLIANRHQTILSREEYFHLYQAPDADGWIEWKGGKCPVEHGLMVDTLWSDGDIVTHDNFGPGIAWVVEATRPNIIAYRLHKPEQVKSTAVGDDETSIEANEGSEAMDYKPTIEQLAADYRNAKDYAERKQKEADAAKSDADAKLAELVAAGKALGLVLSVVAPEPELVITDWRDLQVGDIIQCVGSWQREKTDGMQLPVTALEGPHYNGDLPIRVEVPGVSCPDTWGINFKFIRRP